MEEQIIITPENDEQSVAITRENISVGGGAVNSVNGQTGDVVLTTSDLENTSDYQTGDEVESAISSAISQISVPTKTSELENDGSDGTSTYVEADGLATVATSGSYSDLDNKPTIPTVNDATLTITQNGTSKGTFTANDSDDTTIELSDTTYSNFVGTDGNTGGTAGLVPAPQTTDTDKFLKSDGTWATAGGGGGGPTVVQTTGTSQTDVMSQNATTSLIYLDPGTNSKVRIGSGGSSSGSYLTAVGQGAHTGGNQATALGYNTYARTIGSVAVGDSAQAGSATAHYRAVAIGQQAHAYNLGAVAVGAYSAASSVGEFNIGSSQTSAGYNSSNYRLLSGVYDGQSAHDAVNVGQINTVIDAINSATGSNIPHIGT